MFFLPRLDVFSILRQPVKLVPLGARLSCQTLFRRGWHVFYIKYRCWLARWNHGTMDQAWFGRFWHLETASGARTPGGPTGLSQVVKCSFDGQDMHLVFRWLYHTSFLCFLCGACWDITLDSCVACLLLCYLLYVPCVCLIGLYSCKGCSSWSNLPRQVFRICSWKHELCC